MFEKSRRMLKLIAMKTGLDVSECLEEITQAESDVELGRATRNAYEEDWAMVSKDMVALELDELIKEFCDSEVE